MERLHVVNLQDAQRRMQMIRAVVATVVLLSCISVESALAQTGDGSLRGYVKDEQGGVLPGVTITATSPDVLAPVTAVTDTVGYYRLNNLPPGTYTIVAELQGFSKDQPE